MTENNKKMWDEAMDGISEEYTDEASEKIEEQLDKEINDSELIMVENRKKSKLPLFAAAVVAVIGMSVFVGVIVSNNELFTTSGISGAESDYESDISSDSEIVPTIEDKFRALDQDMRYNEVLKTLGIPYKMGGEYVKYLSYKLDNERLAVVQFLYGDNPRIDYTYISSTLANKMDDEAEFILHRRVCNHEDDYCTHDFYRYDKVSEYIEICSELKHGMNPEEVKDILENPRYEGGGGTSSSQTYYPDDYYALYVDFTYSSNGFVLYRIYLTDKLSGDGECLLHPTNCRHDEGYCVQNSKSDYTRTELAQMHFEDKLQFLELSETNTKQDVLDYVGDPDEIEELNVGDSDEFNHPNEDITRYIYTLDDERTGYICFYNNVGTSPILDCSYIYDKTEKAITSFREISMSCISKTYYDLHN